jgi:hypothetical protein
VELLTPQHQGNLAMVKLKLFPALGVDGPLQASGAMPSVAGMVFMSI